MQYVLKCDKKLHYRMAKASCDEKLNMGAICSVVDFNPT